MYPTLSDLFYDIFGFHFLPVPTFGFFVALSFIAAAACFTLELKRKEEEGLVTPSDEKIQKGAPASLSDLIISGISGFVVGFKVLFIILNWKAFTEAPRDMILSIQGNWIGGILVAGYFVYKTWSDKNKTKLDQPVWELVKVHPYELVSNMTMVAAVSGIIGARLFHILENMGEFQRDPLGMIFSTGGFTFYGGLILGAIAVIYYARKHNIPPLHLIDACAPGLMLAYGVGRIGCQMAGDGDWGITNLLQKPSWLSFLPDWAWAFTYPHNVVNEGIQIPGCAGSYCSVLPLPVYPTPLYECIAGILLFFLLWSVRKKIKTPGVLFCIYLIVNGIERFFIEKIRVNTTYKLFGHAITQAEIISVILVIVGISGIVYFRKQRSASSR